MYVDFNDLAWEKDTFCGTASTVEPVLGDVCQVIEGIGPWWSVDLGAAIFIDSLLIINGGSTS